MNHEPGEAAFVRPDGAMRGRAIGGAINTSAAQLVRLAVQFVSIFVLSRLLPPTQFGLLAMVAPVVGFAALFQDLGLAQAVVQKEPLVQREVSGLFWIGLAMSIALALALSLLSPLVGWFYREPAVVPLTIAMSVNILLGGLMAMPSALLTRRMQFGKLALIEAAGAVVGLVVSIGAALLLHNAWALYLGNLATALTPAIGYWWLARWIPSRPIRHAGVGGALRFGAGITGFNIANFFARNLDNVLIGRVWGERPLGLYDRAYKLLVFPLQQISAPVSRVMLPVLSQMNNDPQRYRAAYTRTLTQMMLVAVPGIAFMVGCAGPLVIVLLGRNWADAAPIFAILGVASFVQVPNNSTGWLFISQSRTRDYTIWGVFSALTSVASFAIGVPYGPRGVALAYMVGEFIRTPLLWWFVGRRGPVSTGDLARLAAPYLSGGIAALLATRAALAHLPSVGLVPLVTAFVVAYGTSLLWLSCFRHGRDAIRQLSMLVATPIARFSRA